MDACEEEEEMVRATMAAEQAACAAASPAKWPAESPLQPLTNRARTDGGVPSGGDAGSTEHGAAAAAAAASAPSSSGISSDDSDDSDDRDDEAGRHVQGTARLVPSKVVAARRAAAAAAAAPAASAAAAAIEAAAQDPLDYSKAAAAAAAIDLTDNDERHPAVPRAAGPAKGEVWGQRVGAGHVVAVVQVEPDGQRVHTVRLYRHTELFTSPYGTEEERRSLVVADKRREIQTSAFMMAHRRLGHYCEAGDGASNPLCVPVGAKHVYHQRFPVGFRSAPSPSAVLEQGDALLFVWCDSLEVVRNLVPRSSSGGSAAAADPLLSQYENCSQDARVTESTSNLTAGSSSDDDECVVHSQGQSSEQSDEDAENDVDDEPDVEVEAEADDDDEVEEDAAVAVEEAEGAEAASVSQRIQAIELYAGCGGLAHLEGRSHGVEITVVWAVECMPEAAATYRANHPGTKGVTACNVCHDMIYRGISESCLRDCLCFFSS